MNNLRRLSYCFLLLLTSIAGALENQLANHPSPYLAMHGADPVHWQDWNPQLLEQAKKEGKLLFISSGYFSCHWCHVMRRESYNNPAIAEILNKHYIPVKLDRELEPALDEYLIDFVQQTQGRAGWPLNVFLTPEGYPLIGMTYLPADDFQRTLNKLQQTWTDEQEELTNMARRALLAMLAGSSKKADKPNVSSQQLVQEFTKVTLQYADEMQGGFGQQNRFPMTSQLNLLLQIHQQKANQQIADFLKLTLDQMANNGMRDQLGGGFFRYTVDPDWLVPHYEKMLYTQALLVRLYMDAAVALARPEYLGVATDTLDFVIHTMPGPQGGYMASFSAVDDQDVEGGYYLWTPKQLQQALPKKMLKQADAFWRLHLDDEDESGRLPLGGVALDALAKKNKQEKDELNKALKQAKIDLLKVRAKRGLPEDNKELAGWNGLMLSAFAQAAMQLKRDDYLNVAKNLRNFLVNNLWQDGQLLRAKNAQRILGAASLEDYAYVAEGLALWAQAANNKADAELSNKLLSIAWEKYHNKAGWTSAANAVLPGMPSNRAQEDGALPSPAAVIIRLSLVSGDAQLIQQAKAVKDITLNKVLDNPFWYASSISALK